MNKDDESDSICTPNDDTNTAGNCDGTVIESERGVNGSTMDSSSAGTWATASSGTEAKNESATVSNVPGPSDSDSTIPDASAPGHGASDGSRVWPLDVDTNTLDLRYLRPTDLPFNKRVFLPSPLHEDTEVGLRNLKVKLLEATSQYIERNRNAATEHSNLTATEKTGLKELRSGRNRDLIIFQTDKSGRFSVDTKENYKRACDEHIRNDRVITEEEHLKCQETINGHSILWCRILRAGECADTSGARGTDRVKNNLLVEHSDTAPLYGLRKDHKVAEDPETGPPVRPVCGATSAYNRKLSHLICKLLKPLWQNNKHSCDNTEDLLAAIRDINSAIRETL